MWIRIIFLFCEIAHLEREPAVSFLAIAMIKFLEGEESFWWEENCSDKVFGGGGKFLVGGKLL